MNEPSVSNAGGRALIDESVAAEAVQSKLLRERVSMTCGEGMSQKRTAGGNRLETTRPPTAIDVQIVDGSRPENRRAVRNDIHDARPMAHEPRLREHRKHLDHRGDRLLDRAERASLAV